MAFQIIQKDQHRTTLDFIRRNVDYADQHPKGDDHDQDNPVPDADLQPPAPPEEPRISPESPVPAENLHIRLQSKLRIPFGLTLKNVEEDNRANPEFNGFQDKVYHFFRSVLRQDYLHPNAENVCTITFY